MLFSAGTSGERVRSETAFVPVLIALVLFMHPQLHAEWSTPCWSELNISKAQDTIGPDPPVQAGHQHQVMHLSGSSLLRLTLAAERHPASTPLLSFQQRKGSFEQHNLLAANVFSGAMLQNYIYDVNDDLSSNNKTGS